MDKTTRISGHIKDALSRHLAQSTPRSFGSKSYPYTGVETFPCVPLKHFNDQPFPIGQHTFDAIDFAKTYNMPEIRGHYRLLPGITRGQMQNYMVLMESDEAEGLITHDDYLQNIEDLWDALVSLNPQLAKVALGPLNGKTPDRDQLVRNKRMTIMGVDDDYNVNDINYFNQYIMSPKAYFNDAASIESKTRKVQEMVDQIEMQTRRFCWRPSLETLTLMQGILESRAENKPQASRNGALPQKPPKPL